MSIQRVPWNNDVLTVRQLLDWAKNEYGDKPCIKFYRDGEIKVKSYRDMCEDSYSVARYIRSLNPERMHVALIAKTNYEYISCFNGIFVSNNVAVPMAYDASPEDTAALINDADVEMVFFDESYAHNEEALKKLCPKVRYYIDLSNPGFFENIYKNYNSESEKAHLSDVEIDPDDCTIIIYTSGTTGTRKGAMLSSRAVISNVYYKEMSFDSSKVTLNVLPMYHIFCFSCDYLKNLKDGVTICLNGDIKNINENLLRFNPHFMRMVPMVIESLLRKTRIIRKNNPDISPREAAEQVFGKNLTNIIAAGAPLSGKVSKEFEDMGITVRQGYGMTETGPRISVPDGKTCGASGGRVISTCRVRIKDGEIQVKSPSLFMGYYKRPEESEKVFTEDGWFRTGDMGRLTEDNELFITGRLKNIIILSNGENVSPEEIEKKFADEPMVKEIVVYGDGDDIVAEIYPDFDYADRNGIKDIEQYMQAAIDRVNASGSASHIIDRVELRKEPFERTSTGKILRHKKSA